MANEEKIAAIDAQINKILDELAKQHPMIQRLLGQKDILMQEEECSEQSAEPGK